MYGESPVTSSHFATRPGLSPRVRGIRLHNKYARPRRRSIPACTGNPAGGARWWWHGKVYPRVYGESEIIAAETAVWAGLSPRVRGIPACAVARSGVPGSIPACTGNPGKTGTAKQPPKVYPRVYGESTPDRKASSLPRGLSPRVRGILTLHRRRSRSVGSIPACTGNPPTGALYGYSTQVYPRVYGESHLFAIRPSA